MILLDLHACPVKPLKGSLLVEIGTGIHTGDPVRKMASKRFYGVLSGHPLDFKHQPIAVTASPLQSHDLVAFIFDGKTLGELVKAFALRQCHVRKKTENGCH